MTASLTRRTSAATMQALGGGGGGGGGGFWVSGFQGLGIQGFWGSRVYRVFCVLRFRALEAWDFRVLGFRVQRARGLLYSRSRVWGLEGFKALGFHAMSRRVATHLNVSGD